MTKTHTELINFIAQARTYATQNPQTKFTHELKKLEKTVTDAITKSGHEAVYQAAVEDARYKYASEDKNKNLVLTPEGAFTFTKESHKKLVDEVKEITKILNETVIELGTPEIPDLAHLDQEQYDLVTTLIPIPENAETNHQ